MTAKVAAPLAVADLSHVVWDWNGTLLDDTGLSTDITNGMLGRRGLPSLSVEGYRRRFGFPLDAYCRDLGFDLEQESFDAVSEEFIEEYERRRLDCQLHRSARALIAAFERAGLEQLVLSAYRQETLDELINHFALRQTLRRTIGVDNDRGEGKVACAQEWIAGAAADPGRVLLIGDTLHDYEVAEAVGATCVLVAHGHQAHGRLRTTGCLVYTDFQALAGALDLRLADGDC